MARGSAFAAAILLAALAAGSALATSPVAGSIFGKVLSAGTGTFAMQSTQVPGGKALVTVGPAAISEQKSGTRADLRKGVCATAMGPAAKNGTVTAQRVSLTAPVKGSCTSGFAGRRRGGRGQRPAGTPRRPPSGSRPFGTFGFAAGAITAVGGSTISLHGPRGTTKVRLAKTVRISRTVDVAASAIRTGVCAFVLGSSTDKGKTVRAQRISLTQATKSGCGGGFRRRPGG